LIAALSGSHIIDLHASIHGELSAHPVQAILDDDVAGMIGRMLEGILVDDDTMALEVIGQVGPVPGHFLGTEHTRRWWKEEWFTPEVADRLGYDEWQQSGKKSALDYARERFEEILATHQPKPLTDEEEAEVEAILEEERGFYRERGLWT
jgi:trimethylamine--corrinoid protein Co-methyltransferase